MGIDEDIAAYEKGDIEAAERLFHDALPVSSNDEDAACCEVYLGVIAGQRGQNGTALEYFKSALKRELSIEMRVNAHYHTGSLFCELQDFVRASEHLSEIEMLVHPEPNADTLEELAHSAFLLGTAFHELGHYEKALQRLRLALQRSQSESPRDRELRAQIQLWTGYVLYHLKRYPEAIRELEEALHSDEGLDAGNRAAGRYYWALCLLELGETERARACIQVLLWDSREESDLPAKYRREASYTLGKICFGREDYTEALNFFQIAIGLSEPEFLRTTYLGSLLGVCLLEVGKAREALPYAKEAYEANPDDGFRAICFAKVISALGDYPQAGAILNAIQANGLPPGVHEDLLIHKCWLYAQMGDQAQYEICYRALKALNRQSRALIDPSRTRWLPPPETVCWPGGGRA